MASAFGQALAAEARRHIGKQYQWGTAGPTTFDCSGLVYFSFNTVSTHDVDASYRDSHKQFTWGIGVESPEPGDILCYDTANGHEVRLGNRCSHVAICTGPDTMVHALNEQKGVIESKISSPWFASKLIGIRRIEGSLGDKPVVPSQEQPTDPKDPAAPSGTIRFPAGSVKTIRPTGGGAYDVPWSNVARWEPSYTRWGQHYAIDPRIMAGMTIIESDANQYVHGGLKGARHEVITRDDGFGDGLSVGLTQVKPRIWERLVPGIDVYDPDSNIRLGTAVMADAIKKHGSWQKALVRVYFPDDDPNGTTQNEYVKTLESLLTEMGVTDVDNPVDPWRPYPYPEMRKDCHVEKPGERAGFDRVSPRGPRIVGSCNHITDGIPGGDQAMWYSNFFSTGGERAWDALTDVVIAQNGDIGLLNDWRDPDWGGRRAGWANGGSDGLEGDGVDFYRHYPLINDVLVSKEHVTVSGKALTEACLGASIELSTAIAQEARCPWLTYPRHPERHNVVIEQQHRNFATKACPAEPFIGTHYAVLVREVKAKLKAWQATGEISQPVDQVFTKFGFRTEQLSYLFGTMRRINQDGTVDELQFSSTGPLSLLWMNRAETEGIFPEAEEITIWDSQLAEGKEYFATWEGGWVAYLPIDNQRAGWRWIS